MSHGGLGMGAYVLVECPSLDTGEHHVPAKPRRGAPTTIMCTRDPFEWGWGQRESEDFFGWGVVHNVDIQGFLGVVDHGHRIASCIIEEALQVGVVNNLDRVLEKLVDKKRTKTRGGEKGDM